MPCRSRAATRSTPFKQGGSRRRTAAKRRRASGCHAVECMDPAHAQLCRTGQGQPRGARRSSRAAAGGAQQPRGAGPQDPPATHLLRRLPSTPPRPATRLRRPSCSKPSRSTGAAAQLRQPAGVLRLCKLHEGRHTPSRGLMQPAQQKPHVAPLCHPTQAAAGYLSNAGLPETAIQLAALGMVFAPMCALPQSKRAQLPTGC